MAEAYGLLDGLEAPELYRDQLRDGKAVHAQPAYRRRLLHPLAVGDGMRLGDGVDGAAGLVAVDYRLLQIIHSGDPSGRLDWAVKSDQRRSSEVPTGSDGRETMPTKPSKTLESRLKTHGTSPETLRTESQAEITLHLENLQG